MRAAGLVLLVVVLVLGGQAAAAPRNGPPMGDFAVEDGAVAGDWVSFDVRPDGVDDFALDGTMLFDARVEATPRAGATLREAHGATTKVRTPLYRLTALDVPHGDLRIEADGAIVLTFPDGAKLAQPASDRVAFTVGTERGFLFARDALDVEGTKVTAQGEVRFRGLGTGASQVESGLANAAADRRIGAVVTATRGAGGELKHVVAEYGGVRVEARAEVGRVDFLVDGNGTDGRVLVFDLDPALVGPRPEFLFNDEPLPEAGSLDDVLDPDDDGLDPERLLVPGPEATRLLVSVPHYSVHTITVRTLEEIPVGGLVAAALAGAALAAGGGVALFRPRRR